MRLGCLLIIIIFSPAGDMSGPTGQSTLVGNFAQHFPLESCCSCLTAQEAAETGAFCEGFWCFFPSRILSTAAHHIPALIKCRIHNWCVGESELL